MPDADLNSNLMMKWLFLFEERLIALQALQSKDYAKTCRWWSLKVQTVGHFIVGHIE